MRTKFARTNKSRDGLSGFRSEVDEEARKRSSSMSEEFTDEETGRRSIPTDGLSSRIEEAAARSGQSRKQPQVNEEATKRTTSKSKDFTDE